MLSLPENESMVRDILQDSRIGLWYIEMDDGKPGRIYADDTFREIMGMDSAMTPEESYRFWFDRIQERDMGKVRAAIAEMIAGHYSEAMYAWNHPKKGVIYIRCGGRRDDTYRRGIRFRGSHQDVSDLARKRLAVERELRRQEQENSLLTRKSQTDRDILNALPGGVAVIRRTPAGVWVPEFLSDGFAAMCDMPVETLWELYRKDAMTGVHPDDQAKLAGELERYFNGTEQCTELVYRLRKGASDYIWVRNAMTLMRNENGSQKVYCVYRDITGELTERDKIRRQYNERLAQHYRVIGPDVLAAGHSNVTRDQVVELIDRTDCGLQARFGTGRNNFFRGLAGCMDNEEERRHFEDTFLNTSVLAAYAAGRTELAETCFVRLPGEERGRYVQCKVNLMTDPDTGDLMGILALTDVTEGTLTRKILAKLSVLGCDLISDVDLCRDRQTFLTAGGVESVSGRWVSFSGYNRNAVETYVVPADRERLSRMLEPDYILRRLGEADSFSFAYSITGDDGRILTKHLTISAVDLRLGRVCTARRDITETIEVEQKHKETLERALEAAEKASRAKSDFLSSMSHDIRTPMNAIMGMTTLAQAHLDDRARLEDCLRKITLSSEHLLGLINDILDMNKIERAQLTLNRERMSLEEILEQMDSMFAAQARMKGLTFTIRRTGDVGRSFYGDRLRINQILINLLGNAMKFTPAGGAVELVAEELPASEKRVGYRLTVGDNGVGMSQSVLSRLFDPFSRGEGVSHVEGSGLGLSITRGLVELMGGTITVESQGGAGSTFRVELTFDEAAGTAPLPPADACDAGDTLPLAGCRLLAAEDNALNAEILAELLAMQGAQLEVAENGARVVEVFRAAPPGTYDAILLDVQMPVMNGYEAARALRALPRPDAGTIPIVAMTANAFDDDVRAALEAGMDAHAAKPVDIQRLVRLLRRLIKRR